MALELVAVETELYFICHFSLQRTNRHRNVVTTKDEFGELGSVS